MATELVVRSPRSYGSFQERAPADPVVDIPQNKPEEIIWHTIKQLEGERDVAFRERRIKRRVQNQSPEELELIDDCTWGKIQSIEKQRKKLEEQNGPGFEYRGKPALEFFRDS